MNKQDIKALFLAHGYKEKPQPDGTIDLNPYVYEAAEALIRRVVSNLDGYAGKATITAPGGTEVALLCREPRPVGELPLFTLRRL